MARPFSGNKGKVTCGGVDVHVTGWTAAAEADALDTTHSGGNGYRSNIPGVKRLQARFRGFYDAERPPFGSPPDLNPGSSVSFALYLESASGPQISGTGTVTGIVVESVVNAVVNFAATLESNGSFTLPTTAF